MIRQTETDSSKETREIHLMDYWRVMWRGRWIVSALFVVVVTLVTIGTYVQTPIYEATAKVEIQAQGSKVLPFYQDVSPMGVNSWSWLGEQRYFNTQYEIIRSKSVAEKVVEKLDLTNHAAFQGAPDPAALLAGRVKVEPIEETGVVLISLTGADPAEITLWTNEIAESYVQRNFDIAMQGTLDAIRQLEDTIEPMREGLRASEQRKFDFVDEETTFTPESRQAQLESRITQLQKDLTETRVRRRGMEAEANKIEEVERTAGNYFVIPKIAADLGLQKLNQDKSALERELNRLQVQYLPKHQKVVEKRAELSKMNTRISSELERLVNNIKTEYTLLVQTEEGLERDIQELQKESLAVTRTASDYEVLRTDSTGRKQLLDLINQRQMEINLNQALISNNIRVLDHALEPRAPIRPRKALNIFIGAILGLMTGVGFVFFLDYMDNTVKTTEDVEQFLNLNLLSVIPRFQEGDYRPVKEAFQTLRTSLLFSRKNRDHNVVLVTSAGPQEGKTSTVVNLAKTLASAGERVVIVDADLRRPSVHEQLNLERNTGLTNFLLSTDGEDWRNYLKIAGIPNLQALTCGPIPPNPPELFGTERFISLIRELRAHFNWVLIDSPPVISLTDSVILSSLVDMVAFVVRHSENDKEMIRRSVNTIRNVNAQVIGAILNDVDLARSHYRDYYYAGYYYYGADRDKPRKRTKKVRATA